MGLVVQLICDKCPPGSKTRTLDLVFDEPEQSLGELLTSAEESNGWGLAMVDGRVAAAYCRECSFDGC